MPLFDRYIAVDWSASGRPRDGADSIWIACLGTGGSAPEVANPPTRREAESRLLEILVTAVRRRERVLIGCDFPYGYPRGLAALLGFDGKPWKAMWSHLARHVSDDAGNRNNRFDVAASINHRLGDAAAFWGCPATIRLSGLSARKNVSYAAGGETGTAGGQAGRLAEFRRVERQLRCRGRQPQSAWKLTGAGAAGSQSLVGIPMVHRLRTHRVLGPVSRVWPFELSLPRLPAGRPGIVHAEIWPSLVELPAEWAGCRDERQVRAVAGEWRRLDARDSLAGWFQIPAGDPAVREEEGWILGAGART